MTDTPPIRGLAVGIDIGGTKIEIMVADQSGTVRGRSRIPTEAADGALSVVQRAAIAANALITEADLDGHRRRLSCVIGIPGIQTHGRVAMSPNIPGWEEVRIDDEVAAILATTTITVENDVNLSTLAELTNGALHGVSDGVYLSLGTGVAAGIVVNGHLVRGHNGAAGEVGYLPVAAGHGTLVEHVIGGRAIEERAAREYGLEGVRAVDLLLATTGPQSGLAAEIREQVAHTVSQLSIILNPSVIALGGGLMHAAPTLLPAIESAISGQSFPPQLRQAMYVYDASVHGALFAAHAVLNDVPALSEEEGVAR
ncbi:ROK family protein [Pedococcus sp. P5_B7]